MLHVTELCCTTAIAVDAIRFVSERLYPVHEFSNLPALDMKNVYPVERPLKMENVMAQLVW